MSVRSVGLHFSGWPTGSGIALWAGLLALVFGAGALLAGAIHVPNASFESPVTTFVSVNVDSWQKAAKPDWYEETGGFEWTQLTGLFKNTPTNAADHIDNMDGSQALWLFAVPEVALYQDYDSMDWNDAVPTHAFDATYELGHSYRLTVGVVGNGGGMRPEATLELGLYYRDAASNQLVVATTVLTNKPGVFSNTTHFVDCEVTVPPVRFDDPWAGKQIGIRFLSTVSYELRGGYWDLDHVRLQDIPPTTLSASSWNQGRFQLTLRSEPGLRFEILVATNLALPPSQWLSLGTVSNATGEAAFTDFEASPAGRFYQARQLP